MTETPATLSQALDRVLDGAVASGRIVGAVVIAARDGEPVYRRAVGHADREAGTPMRETTPMRLASLTKPLVSAAALRLVETGDMSLDAAVTDWLPDFRPALPDGQRPVIRIRHLLSHTAGLGYRFLQPPDGPYHRFDVSDGMDDGERTLDENLARIAAAPLLFPPGAGWCYSVATDVLGAVVSRAAGMSLPDSVRSLVTAPLGMASTGFGAEDPASVATAYIDADPAARRMEDPDGLDFGPGRIVYRPSFVFDHERFSSGGGGMVGTAPDYLAFLEAVRRGGGGVLSASTCALMTTPAAPLGSVFIPGPGWGFGLGFGIVTDPATAASPLSPGSWGWTGIFGANAWVDPVRRITLVALTNTALYGMVGPFPDALRDAVISGTATESA